MGIFVEALDIAIVNLALPQIEKDLGLSNDSGYKLQSLYVLIYGCFLILGGKLSDYIGKKQIFMGGALIFLVTSLGAGLSHTYYPLLFFRAFQGLGAALLMPSAFAIVSYYFPEPQERSKAIGIFGSFAATGSAGGLSVGGIIANYWGWSWVFLINVPVLLVILVLAYIYLERDVKSDSQVPDIPGAIALVVAMLCLSWITELLSKEGGWQSIGVAFIVMVVAGWYLVRRLKTQAHPLLDLEVLSLSSLRTGNALFLLLGAIFTGYLFIMSFVIQQHFHFSAAASGMIMMPFSILSMLLGRFGLPFLSARISSRQIALAGACAMLTGAMALVVAVQCHNLVCLLIGGTCIAGIGMTLCFTGYSVIAMEQVPEAQLGVGASLINTAYFVGGGIGLPLISVFMDSSKPLLLLGAMALGSILILRAKQSRKS